MVKICLGEIVNSKLDLGDNIKNSINNIINSFEEEQLVNILRTPNGIIIGDIRIHFLPLVGFRCSNDYKLGKMPICNIITRILNKKYQEITLNQNN